MKRFAFILFLVLTISTLVMILLQLSVILTVSSGSYLSAVGGLTVHILFFVLFASLAIKFSPWAEASAKAAEVTFSKFQSLSQQEKVDFIAAEAARRLRVSRDDSSSLLSDELRVTPRDVMNCLEDIGAEFDLPLSESNYPEINSIDAIADVVRRHPATG